MTVFACYSTQRSGHNSVIWWLMNQQPSIKYKPSYTVCQMLHVNNCLRFELSVPRKRLCTTTPPTEPYDHIFLVYETEQIQFLRKYIAKYEDRERFIGNSITEIVILRDFKNTIASHIRRGGIRHFPELTLETWRDRAHAVLNGMYWINYNRYHCDREYRRQICTDLGFYFTDYGLYMLTPNGGGSSFTQKNALDRASLNKRYKTVEDNNTYQTIIQSNGDCVKISEHLFGLV